MSGMKESRDTADHEQLLLDLQQKQSQQEEQHGRQHLPSEAGGETVTMMAGRAVLLTTATTPAGDCKQPNPSPPVGFGSTERVGALSQTVSRPFHSIAVHRGDTSRQDSSQGSAEDSSKPSAIPPCTGVGRTETVIALQGYRRQLEEEIRKLSESATKDYIEALQMAPPQVWEESNPKHFLRVESFSTKFAAKRLAMYWQLRSNTFGSKRYDSLYQTGEDALDRRDVSTLGSNFLNLLPNDAHGCPVLWLDFSRVRAGVPDESRDRCIFYMFSLLAENEMSQGIGAVLLYKMGSPPFGIANTAFLERLVNSLPLRFKAVHLLSDHGIPSTVASQIKFGGQTHVHVGTTNFLSKRLEAFGLSKAGLPKWLNGGWGYEKFVHWQELRTRFEWKIPVGLSGRDSAEAFEFPAIRPYTVLPETKKTERKRRLNVIHSRRKRSRERVELHVLEEQISELKDERGRLVHQNRMLEDLARAATAMVEREKEKSSRTHVVAAQIQGQPLGYPTDLASLLGATTHPWQDITMGNERVIAELARFGQVQRPFPEVQFGRHPVAVGHRMSQQQQPFYGLRSAQEAAEVDQLPAISSSLLSSATPGSHMALAAGASAQIQGQSLGYPASLTSALTLQDIMRLNGQTNAAPTRVVHQAQQPVPEDRSRYPPVVHRNSQQQQLFYGSRSAQESEQVGQLPAFSSSLFKQWDTRQPHDFISMY
jgi:hypothetical protein